MNDYDFSKLLTMMENIGKMLDDDIKKESSRIEEETTAQMALLAGITVGLIQQLIFLHSCMDVLTDPSKKKVTERSAQALQQKIDSLSKLDQEMPKPFFEGMKMSLEVLQSQVTRLKSSGGK